MEFLTKMAERALGFMQTFKKTPTCKMKTKEIIGVFSFLFILITLGCDRDNVAKKSTSKLQPQVTAIPKDDGQNLVYSGPNSYEEVKKFYGTECSGGMCIITTQPNTAPIKKKNGNPVCIIAKYESISVATIYISRDDRTEGADCQISASDYEAIANQYGELNVYKKYLDQHTNIDFKTWKTKSGYITTYKQIEGINPNGGVMYEYHVYVGFVEHRHYSKYIAQ